MRRLGSLAAVFVLVGALAMPVAALAQEVDPSTPPVPTSGECVVCHALPAVVTEGLVPNPNGAQPQLEQK